MAKKLKTPPVAAPLATPVALEPVADAPTTLPVTALHGAPWNPRANGHLPSADLVASVAEQGIIQPLVVRPVDGGPTPYQIIAGHSRWLAAQTVGLATVPVVVVDAHEERAREVALVENLHRADMPPMAEARAFEQLVGATRTLAQVAQRVGKAPGYVAKRLGLLKLTPALQERVETNQWTVAHALELVGLPPEEQERLMGIIERDTYRTWTPRDVRGLVERDVYLDLSKAAFSKTDATLVPERGACAACPFMAGSQPLLFPEGVKPGTCTMPECFRQKVVVHTQRLAERTVEQYPDAVLISHQYAKPTTGGAAKLEAIVGDRPVLYGTQYERAKKNEKGAVPAVVVDDYHGLDVGRVEYVKLRKPKADTTGTGRSLSDGHTAEDRRAKRADRLVRTGVFDAICAKASWPLTAPQVQAIACAMGHGAVTDYLVDTLKLPVKKTFAEHPLRKAKLTPTQLAKAVVALAFHAQAHGPTFMLADALVEMAGPAWGVDVKALRASAKAEVAPKGKKAAPPPTKPAPKARKKGARR
jgi:ParB/RepB/Spo0J family partition protein